MLGEPYVPTEAEREEHEKSHLPWRSWRSDCVGSGAVSQPHHPTPEDPRNNVPATPSSAGVKPETETAISLQAVAFGRV